MVTVAKQITFEYSSADNLRSTFGGRDLNKIKYKNNNIVSNSMKTIRKGKSDIIIVLDTFRVPVVNHRSSRLNVK